MATKLVTTLSKKAQEVRRIKKYQERKDAERASREHTKRERASKKERAKIKVQIKERILEAIRRCANDGNYSMAIINECFVPGVPYGFTIFGGGVPMKLFPPKCIENNEIRCWLKKLGFQVTQEGNLCSHINSLRLGFVI